MRWVLLFLQKKSNMIKNLPFIISALIVGIVLFQSIFIAPAINKLITIKEASVFLRHIWPKFFLIIASLSAISIFTLFTINTDNILAKWYIIISFFLMISCYFITPLINHAKDAGNDQLWSILHLVTVIATLITLISNILNIIYWKLSQ